MHKHEEDVKFITKQLANALNRLDVARDKADYLFEINPEWNNMVTYTIDDAIAKLGIALAAFVTWFDEPEEESNSQGE